MCQLNIGELGPVLLKAWAESRSGWYESLEWHLLIVKVWRRLVRPRQSNTQRFMMYEYVRCMHNVAGSMAMVPEY